MLGSSSQLSHTSSSAMYQTESSNRKSSRDGFSMVGGSYSSEGGYLGGDTVSGGYTYHTTMETRTMTGNGGGYSISISSGKPEATVNGNSGSYSVSTSGGRPEAMMTGSNGGYSISTSGGRPAATMTVNISRTNHPQAARSNSLEQQRLLEKAVESRYGRGGNGGADYSVNYQYSTVRSVSTMPRKSSGGHVTVGGSYQVRYIAVCCIIQVEVCVIITCIMIFLHDTEYPPWYS